MANQNKPIINKRTARIIMFVSLLLVTVVSCWFLSKYCGPGSKYHVFAELICMGFFFGFILMMIISEHVILYFELSVLPLAMIISVNHLYTEDGIISYFGFLSGANSYLKVLVPLAIVVVIYLAAWVFSWVVSASFHKTHKTNISESYSRVQNKLREIKLARLTKENIQLKTKNDKLIKENRANKNKKNSSNGNQETIDVNKNNNNNERHDLLYKIIISCIVGVIILAWVVFSIIGSFKTTKISTDNINAFYETASVLAIPVAIALLTIATFFGIFSKQKSEASVLSKTAPWGLVLFFISMIIDNVKDEQSPLAWIKKYLADGDYVVPTLTIMVAIVITFITAKLISHVIKAFDPSPDKSKDDESIRKKADDIAKETIEKSMNVVSKVIKIVYGTMEGILDTILFIPNFLKSLNPLIIDEEPNNKKNNETENN